MKYFIIFFLLIYCNICTATAQDEVNDEAPFGYGQPESHEITPEANANPTTNITTQEKLAAPAPINSGTDQKNFTKIAILQGLDKITARTSTLKVTLGEPIKFGNLKITLHSCWKSPPEEAPESKALLEMWEEIPGEPRKKIWSGWMFASSPLISAPEHLVYDITLLECS